MVELGKTKVFGMTVRRETLNGRVIETAFHRAWRTILPLRTSARNTEHMWMKHGVVLYIIFSLTS